MLLDSYSYNGKMAVIFIFIATFVQSVFGFARDASPFFKLVIALLCWGAVFYSLKNGMSINRYPQKARTILSLTFICIGVSFINAILLGEVASGNKYIVLFTNMYSILDIIGVVFIFTISSVLVLKHFLKYTKWYILFSFLMLVVNFQTTVESYSLSYPLIYATIFLPYVNFRDKLFIIAGLLLSVLAFFGGGRQIAMLLLFAIASICAGEFLSKKITFIASLFIAILPFVLIVFSINNISIFELLSERVSDDESMRGDTRTFLYLEFFEDYLDQSLFTQLFGKGALGHYFSYFFQGKSRFGIEVPVLQWAIQAGLIYVLLFTLIVFYSIVELYRKGDNKLSKIASVLIASFYLNCYVSNLIGCNIAYLGFWFLIYISFSNKFTSISDKQLSVILK